MRTPNIVSGTVTRRERRTPSWLRAFYAFILGVVAIVALALILAPDDSAAGCKAQTHVSDAPLSRKDHL